MQVDIFDVAHGHCTVMTAPNGTRMMLDCGARWDEDDFWTPSLHYLGQRIDLLALLNLDEDHIENFGPMTENCHVPWVLSNPTIGVREFTTLKKAGMGLGAQAVAKWLGAPKGVATTPQPDFGAVQVRWYYKLYQGPNDNTNDLSLAVVIQFGAFKMVFAGDLEAKGWAALLQNPQFRLDMVGVTIFVASHHGRESGCSDELFKLMNPEIVIFSDDSRQYETQETDGWYRQRCRGAAKISDPSQRRYVLTTRRDGSMRINAQADGQWTLNPGIVVKSWSRTKPKTDFNWLAALNPPSSQPDYNSLAALLAKPTPNLDWLTPRNPLAPEPDYNSLLALLARK